MACPGEGVEGRMSAAPLFGLPFGSFFGRMTLVDDDEGDASVVVLECVIFQSVIRTFC